MLTFQVCALKIYDGQAAYPNTSAYEGYACLECHRKIPRPTISWMRGKIIEVLNVDVQTEVVCLPE